MNVEFLKQQVAKKSTADLKRCHKIYASLQAKSLRDEIYRTLLENELARRLSAA